MCDCEIGQDCPWPHAIHGEGPVRILQVDNRHFRTVLRSDHNVFAIEAKAEVARSRVRPIGKHQGIAIERQVDGRLEG